ncbi:DUF1345 domain-containing protein [Caenibius tardaugens NBRC 16725]|nr:DUF1345 domain-containing protein [Caenibius tardaugens NBRC 16725]
MLDRIPHFRYIVFLAAFALAWWPLAAIMPTTGAVIAAFDVAVAVFVASCIPLWRSDSADAMRRRAKRDDAGQILLLLFTALITSVILVALGTLVMRKGALTPGEIVLLVTTLLACWTFVNLIYAFHYARQYYASHAGEDRKGLDFPGGCTPNFSDFVNFAFVIGMTCQTADIDITSAHVRRVSTFHGLFAFAFNLGILALTVNVLAGA